jgi:hypothetical protein
MRKSLLVFATLSALSSFASAGISRTAIFLRGVRDGDLPSFGVTRNRKDSKNWKNKARIANKMSSIRHQIMRKK